MNISLGLRLNFLSSLAKSHGQGEFYDFCCDHGHLGLSLVDNSQYSKIILIDQVDSIISNLTKETSDIPKGKLSVLLEDCTKIKINAENEKTVAIAGIGGKLSVRILENIFRYLNNNDIVILSPHNNIDSVREYLRTTKLGLLEEHLIKENNQFYEIFVLSRFSRSPIDQVGFFTTSSKETKVEYFQNKINYLKNKLLFSTDISLSSLHDTFCKRLTELQND